MTDASPVASLEVAGPGFINVTFRGPFLDEQMTLMSEDSRLGVQLPTTLETVVIDYSAPNVGKEMHVGHLRTTVVGDALARLYGFDGHRVIREGVTQKDGRLPVNPSGGLKARGHPIGSTGVSQHFMAAMQLAGEAEGMQIPDAKLAGVFNMGGAAVANYVSIMERVK